MADDIDMEEPRSTGAAKTAGVLGFLATIPLVGHFFAKSRVPHNIALLREYHAKRLEAGSDPLKTAEEFAKGHEELSKSMQEGGALNKAIAGLDTKVTEPVTKKFDETIAAANKTKTTTEAIKALEGKAEDVVTKGTAEAEKAFKVAENSAEAARSESLAKLVFKDIGGPKARYWDALSRNQKIVGVAITAVTAVAIGAIIKGVVNKMTKPKTFAEQVETSREEPAAAPSR